MKKAIVILAVLLCTFALFAAEKKNSINVKFSPYTLQALSSSNEGDDSVLSRYGLGAEVSYQRYLVAGLYAELGIGWDTYLMPEDRPNFTNLIYFGCIGYKFDDLVGRLSVNSHIGICGDTLLYNGKVAENLTTTVGVNLGYDLGETTEVTVGCDATFGFAKNSSAFYVTYRVIPTVGVTFNF